MLCHDQQAAGRCCRRNHRLRHLPLLNAPTSDWKKLAIKLYSLGDQEKLFLIG
jgi:hypothetical protein